MSMKRVAAVFFLLERKSKRKVTQLDQRSTNAGMNLP
jgi:hypothetical protein